MKKKRKNKISIVAPFYNEEKGLSEFFSRVESVLDRIPFEYEIICINDGSRDNTFDHLILEHRRNPKIKLINFPEILAKRQHFPVVYFMLREI